MTDDTTATKDSRVRRIALKLLLVPMWLVFAVITLLLTAVCVLFLYVSILPAFWANIAIASVFAMTVLGVLLFLRPRWRGALAVAVLLGIIFTWYTLIPASNDRDWLPDVARVVSVEFDGDLVTIENVRNFRYRALDDFDEVWETRTYDLSQLERTDIFFSYWGPTNIAHTMLSFGFADGRHLGLSVETRKEVGEEYDPLASLFKQFELIYILGDERDLVGQRTHVRQEDTYVFPMRLTAEQSRLLLTDILQTADELGRNPQYYATLAHNCTTSLLVHLNKVQEPIPFSWKLLMNGFIPELAYERGNLPTDAPFEEVMQRFAISERARAGDIGEDFSQRIREGVPGMDGRE